MKKNSWAEDPSNLVNICDLGFPWRAFLKYLCRQGFEYWMINETKYNHSPHLFIFSSGFLLPFILLMRIWKTGWLHCLYLYPSQIQSDHPYSSLVLLDDCGPYRSILSVQSSRTCFENIFVNSWKVIVCQCFTPISTEKKRFWYLDRKHFESFWQSKMYYEAEDEMSCPMNS